jgi:hypothetical protein
VVKFKNVGTCVINLVQVGDANYLPATKLMQTFTVIKADQAITIQSSAPAAQVAGAIYTPLAVSSSGLQVMVSVDASSTSICSLTSAAVSFLAAGTCTLNFNQAGNGNYYAAPQVQQLVTVSPGAQKISINTITNAGVMSGTAPLPVAVAKSGLPVSVSIDASTANVCSISPTGITFLAAGICTVDFDQAGNGNWSAASTVQKNITVAKGIQTFVTVSTAPAAMTVGDTYVVSATTSLVGYAVTVTSPSNKICTVSGLTVTAIGSGFCLLTITQAGDSNWKSVAVSQSIAVLAKGQTITSISTPLTSPVKDGVYKPTGTTSSGLAVTVTVDASSASVCSLTGGTVRVKATGSCMLVFNQAGSSAYLPAAPVVQLLSVSL